MTDKAELIINELAAVCAALGMPVEIDRRYDLAEDECPAVIIRTGEEEVAPAEGAPAIIWDRRWVMRPVVEIYIREPATAKQRAELNRIWAEFRAAMKASQILQLIAAGSLPEMRRELIEPDEAPAITGMAIELGLTFDR